MKEINCRVRITFLQANWFDPGLFLVAIVSRKTSYSLLYMVYCIYVAHNYGNVYYILIYNT